MFVLIGEEEQYLKQVNDKLFICLLCEKQVPRKDNAKRHVRLKHFQDEGTDGWLCNLCNKSFRNQLFFDDHNRRSHGVYKSAQQPSNQQY